jgi:prepilin-type N-terminal cleavage/methylation domain-containing protein
MKKEFAMKKNRGFTLVELLASMALLALIVLMVFTIFNQATKVWRKAGARTDQYIAARTVLEQIAREVRGAVLVTQFAVPGSNSTMGRMDFLALHAGANGDWVLNGWRTAGSYQEQPCSDQIYFVAPVETGSQAKQDYAIIGYWVEDPNKDTTGTYNSNLRRFENIKGHKDDVLRRMFVTDASGNPRWQDMDFTKPNGIGSVNDEFALNVKSLSIRCWSDLPDASHFTEQWEDKDSSPANESKSSWNTQDGAGTYDGNRLPKAVKITITVQDQNETEKEREFSTVVYLDNAVR